MPTEPKYAKKFSTFGFHNGFPYCVSKVDATLYNYVAEMTLEQVSNLYYNFYSVTHPTIRVSDGTYTRTIPEGDMVVGTVIDEGVDYNSLTPTPLPSYWICQSGGFFSFNSVKDPFSLASAGIELRNPRIVEFYDGDPNNGGTPTGGWGVENILNIYSGIVLYKVNQTFYRSYGELIDWEPDEPDNSPILRDSWWWNKGFMGYYYLEDSTSIPNSVTKTRLNGIPILRVEYTGRDSQVLDNTWTVPSLQEDTCLNFYEYPPS